MKKEKQFFITCITLILLAMTVLVSCGNDPFFHHVTVNNYRGEAVNSFIHYDGDNYTFPGEMDGFTNILEWVYDGKTYDIGEQVYFPEDSVITAVTGHILSVDNGNDTEQSLVVKEGNTTFTLPEAPTERTGYVFDGWLVDGVLKDASAVVDFSVDLEIEAKWTKIYTVTYDANKGTGTADPTILRDDVNSIKLSDGSSLENSVMKFYGWNTSADESGTFYKGGADYSEKKDVTLYAVWRNEITVTFNSNGGTAVSPQKVVSGTCAARPSAPVRKNAIFRFWSLDGVNAFNFNTTLFENTMLIAVWKTTFTVGERGPANGIIYYINPKSGGGWTYLEASESALVGVYTWGPARSFGVTSGEDGDGYVNTKTVYDNMTSDEKSGSSAIAAIKRHSNIANGVTYDDWFVPNYGDLVRLYFARKDSKILALPAYSSGNYWVSTEYSYNSAAQARIYDIGAGTTPSPISKGESYSVLPVRRF